jgi:hypothetical protein
MIQLSATYYKRILSFCFASPVELVIKTFTKAELDTIIANSALIQVQCTKISGVHPTLLHDGTTSGTTI